MSLFQHMSGSIRDAVSDNAPWLICESAQVAENDDPDKQHRIKVVIPSIDEDQAYDDWVRPLTAFAMGDGFGLVSIPQKGDEVLIFGTLGQKFNLFYIGSAYNEETRKSDRLDIDTPGIDAPQNLAFFAALLMTMRAQNLQVLIEQLAHIEAQNTEVIASQLAKMTGENVQLIASQLAQLTGSSVQITADEDLTIHGGTVSVNSDGSITIHGGGNASISSSGNVSVNATGNLTLQNRLVNKVGPAI